MTTILKAHNQWANRPADERYFDLPEMLVAAKTVKQQAVELPGVLRDLRVEAGEDNVTLVGKQGVPAIVSNYAFGQLSARVGAPAGYLRSLPTKLAVENLNHGLGALAAEEASNAKLLFNRNGNFVLRAATTERYSRLWDADLIEMVQGALGPTWKTPRAWPAGLTGERTRAATKDDVMPGSIIQEGQTIAPAGAYLSDRSMFMFLIDTETPVDDGTGSPMYRGFILGNSEVGASSVFMSVFDFKVACGNHRILGAENVFEFSHRHIGKVEDTMRRSFELSVKKLASSSVSDEEAQIEAERKLILGNTKEEVIAAVLAFAKKKNLGRITGKLMDKAYTAAVEHEGWYGNPHSLYGITNGITEVAQTLTAHVDERHEIDVQAGKLLNMASTF